MSSRPENWTGAGWYFCAAHVGEDGRMHGHTYEVTAWWPSYPHRDQVDLQVLLKLLLADRYDHRTLPADFSTMELLAAGIGGELPGGCVGIDISRPAERLAAKWRR